MDEAWDHELLGDRFLERCALVFFTLLLVFQVLWILLAKTVVTPALEHCFIKPHTLDISSELRNFKSDCENRVCLKQGLVGEGERHMAEDRRLACSSILALPSLSGL